MFSLAEFVELLRLVAAARNTNQISLFVGRVDWRGREFHPCREVFDQRTRIRKKEQSSSVVSAVSSAVVSVSGSTEAKGIRGDGGIVTESSERLTITTAAGQQQREKGTKIFCRKERRPTRLGTSAIHKTRIDGDYTESGSAVLFPQNCNVDWFSYNVAEGPVCLRVCLCWTREKLARLAGWNHEPARWIIFVQYNEKEREGGTRIIRFGISRIVFSFNQKAAALTSSGSTGRTCLLFLFLPSYCI